MRNAKLIISQGVKLVLILLGLLLVLIFIIGLRGNVERMGDFLKSIIGGVL